MSRTDLHLEPLAAGGTLLTWRTELRVGSRVFPQELRFAVRLEPTIVRRLIRELGPERAVYTLWTHYRKIPSASAALDAERLSLEEWAKAVEALIAEVRGGDPEAHTPSPQGDGV
jgi:hypothetical protein